MVGIKLATLMGEITSTGYVANDLQLTTLKS